LVLNWLIIWPTLSVLLIAVTPPLFDVHGAETRATREKQAADRLFGLLPVDQRLALRSGWDEFEAGSSAIAPFAKSLDRLQPIILNHLNRGVTWAEYSIDVGRGRRLTNSI
jgi:putative hydrolase of HD superfamily